jgi:pSer/pThr/pTyr-binding forkhead associated (FHA) protein
MSAASLFALTEHARIALGGSEFTITQFPYRMGRESRKYDTPEKKAFFADKRSPANKPNNDVYLVEDTDLINVSREHFQIERAEGGFLLRDRGSTLGTIVEGRTVGGEGAGGSVALRDGDVIIVGSPTSPFVFKFRQTGK